MNAEEKNRIDEIREEMRKLAKNETNVEEAHIHADGLLCELVYIFGYKDIVALYDKIDMWYS